MTIEGATAATYTVTADDRGKKLTARITGALDGYPSVTRQRTTTATVAG